MDIELTSYGKQLLSRGLFKPAYYAFSDDGVLYDQKWMTDTTATEQQSEIEPRIQEETPRLKSQSRKIGTEKAVFNYNFDIKNFIGQVDNLMSLGEITNVYNFWLDLYKYNVSPQFAESEKLLENTLGTKSFFNSYNPAWNILAYKDNISSSTSYYKKNDITTNIPQINCTIKDVVYKLDYKLDPYDILPQAKSIKKKIGKNKNYFKEYPISSQMGGTIFIMKDFLFFSIEEANSEFTLDNFTIEVFEVTTNTKEEDGEEELQKMHFNSAGKADNALEINNILDIEVDEGINSHLACYLIGKDKVLKDKSIYLSNIYDCSAIPEPEGVTQDPYIGLPDVDIGDVC